MDHTDVFSYSYNTTNTRTSYVRHHSLIFQDTIDKPIKNCSKMARISSPCRVELLFFQANVIRSARIVAGSSCGNTIIWASFWCEFTATILCWITHVMTHSSVFLLFSLLLCLPCLCCFCCCCCCCCCCHCCCIVVLTVYRNANYIIKWNECGFRPRFCTVRL